MLKAEATVEEIGRQVAEFLSRYISVEKIILFGSYAYGHPRPDSDFDLAIISQDLEKMDILKKIELFAKVSVIVDSRVELKGFSKKEFLEAAKGSLPEMIKNRGRIIYGN